MQLLISLREIKSRVKASPFARRIVHGSIWSLVAALLSRGMPIVAMIIVARILEKATYGKLGIVQSSVTMFSSLAAAGMGITAAKHVAASRQTDKQRSGRVIALSTVTALLMGIAMATLLFVLAPWLASKTLSSPELSGALRIGAVILMLGAWVETQTGILTGFEAFRALALTNGGSGIVSIPVITYGAYAGGISGALWGLAGATLLAVIMNGIAIYRIMRDESVPVTKTITKDEWRLLWHFSIPAIFGGIMIGPVIWVGATLLVNQPDGYAEMATFSAANQWFSALLFLPGVVTSALLPIFCDFASQGDYSRVAHSLKASTKIIVLVLVPMSLTAIVASPFIMGLYGPGYSKGWPVLVVIILAAMATATLNLYGNLLAAYNRMWTHFMTNIMWAIVYLAASSILLHYQFGALALAYGMLIAYSIKLLIVKTIVSRHMRRA